jgi:hypothetical protein
MKYMLHNPILSGTLLQNTFLVSVDNPFLVSAVLADTIYTIRKMNDFWYRLFRTDTNNINRVNTQFSSGPFVVIVAERPIGNVLPPFFPSKDGPNCDQAHTETPPTSKRLGLTELQSGLHELPRTLWTLSPRSVQQIAGITFINWIGCL